MNGVTRNWFRQLRREQYRTDVEFFERMARIDAPLRLEDIQMTVHVTHGHDMGRSGPWTMQRGTPTQLASLGLIVANRLHQERRQAEYDKLVRDVQTPRKPLNEAARKALSEFDLTPSFSWETEPRVKIAPITPWWIEVGVDEVYAQLRSLHQFDFVTEDPARHRYLARVRSEP